MIIVGCQVNSCELTIAILIRVLEVGCQQVRQRITKALGLKYLVVFDTTGEIKAVSPDD